jgi:hypothetical protein
MSNGSIAFSTSLHRLVFHPGGSTYVVPQNVYAFDPASGVITVVFDGAALGLPDIDAVEVLATNRVVFSTKADVFVMTPSGGRSIRQQNAYLYNGGELTLMVDGEALGLHTLDAISLEELQLLVDREEILWTPSEGAVGYDVVRGDLVALRANSGNFAVSTTDCLASELADPALAFSEEPADGGFWILVRPVTASGPGTYDTTSVQQAASRDQGIADSGLDCP